MPLRYNAQPTPSNGSPGTFNTLVAGSSVNGATVDIGDMQRQKLRSLSALVQLNVQTGSFTVSGKWQVSDNGTTWFDVTNGPQNAASVIYGTGAGSPQAINKVVPCSAEMLGWRKARFVLVTGGATGAAVDTYLVGYTYRMGN